MLGAPFQPPLWFCAVVLLVLLFSVIVPPLFFGVGIYRLANKTHRNSSFIATCAILALISTTGLIGGDEGAPSGLLLMLTMPFCLFGVALDHLLGSIHFAVGIGLFFTWFTVFGLVTSFQNRFSAEPL